jgi:hypothetical protein
LALVRCSFGTIGASYRAARSGPLTSSLSFNSNLIWTSSSSAPASLVPSTSSSEPYDVVSAGRHTANMLLKTPQTSNHQTLSCATLELASLNRNIDLGHRRLHQHSIPRYLPQRHPALAAHDMLLHRAYYEMSGAACRCSCQRDLLMATATFWLRSAPYSRVASPVTCTWKSCYGAFSILAISITSPPRNDGACQLPF